MRNRTFIRSPYDGLNISLLKSMPQQSPKAIIIFSHGVCGRKERFINIIDYLTQEGFICIIHDHRGHGESVICEEDRGYSYQGRSKAIVMDIKAIADWARQFHPNLPIFLIGHSMGSMAARVFTKSHDKDIDGLILCGSPSYNPLSPIGYLLSKTISLFKKGKIRVGIQQKITSAGYNKRFKDEGPMAWTCSDPTVREQVRQEPACTFDLTADYGLALMELMRETYSTKGWNCTNSSLPILFLSGEDDPCLIDEQAFRHAVDLMKRVGYNNVTYKLYPGMRHEVLHEIGKEIVFQDIINFIDNNLLTLNT